MDDRTVTGRVVAVLDAVAAHSQPVTLAELTRSTGVPKPTVRRIAADLVSRRMLERCDDGRYRLGSRLLGLGLHAMAQQGLLQAVTPHVQDLFARTREVVWVVAVTGSGIALLDSAFGANRAHTMRPGSWPPIDSCAAGFHASALGRVVLADQPELVERLRSRPLRALTPYTTTSWPQLTTELDAVRDTAVATEHQQTGIGYSCVATGIRGSDGSLIGVIGVAGRTGNVQTHRLARPLLTAARDTARALA
jgi:DNA-binding IclR family transcriptional regulator